MEKALPSIPAKRYFTIGEVSELCGVKPYVLRYWEQEFTQLKPMKRRGNRRYYQHHEVLLVRRIRELLYDQGFTISGARNRLSDALSAMRQAVPEAGHGGNGSGAMTANDLAGPDSSDPLDGNDQAAAAAGSAATPLSTRAAASAAGSVEAPAATVALDIAPLRAELLSIRDLLVA